MQIKSLRLQNFRSFLDATFQFPEKGLVLICGKDIETGESSGTGKTAIFLGLSYALDILPKGFTAVALQNWDTEDPLQVTLEIEHEGGTIVLSRGKLTQVDFGDRQVKGAKSYPEALKEIFGFGPEILSALTYRHQDEAGFFLSMGPAQKIEFLTQILGLGHIEKAVEVAEASIKKLEISIATEKGVRTRLADLLTEAENRPVPNPVDEELLGRRVQELNETVADLEEILATAQKEYSELVKAAKEANAGVVAETQQKIQQADKFLAQAKAAFMQQEADYDQAKDSVQREIREFSQELRNIEERKVKAKRLEQEIAAMAVGTCPTCEQEWDRSEEMRTKKVAELDFLRQEIGLEGWAKTRLAELHEQNSKLSRPINEKANQLNLVKDKLIAQLVGLQRVPEDPAIAKVAGVINAAQNELAKVTRDRFDAISILKDAQNRNVVCKQAHDSKHAAIDARIRDLVQSDAKLADLTEQVNAEKDFVSLMGREGFLGVIFDEILQEIVVEVNTRLRLLANVNRVTLSFTTETVGGRRQIQAWVDVRGHRAKLETGPSGGMRTSVEQVTDLAVMDVISRRSGGKVPGWLCLDEVFNGQGTVTKEAALDILSQQNRLVMVIDHGIDLKEAFSQRIDIEFDPNTGISKVVS